MTVGVAVIGCGTISHEYLRNLTSFPDLRVLACGDLDVARAREVAGRYGVPAAGPPDVALAADGVEIVVNLTIPAAHVDVALAAVAAFVDIASTVESVDPLPAGWDPFTRTPA